MFPTTHLSILLAMKQTVTREQAFERFDQLYREPIIAWCRGQGLQHANAEDVTQAVLLELWRHLRSFEYKPEKGRFRSWLATVVRHAIADHFRNQKRHPEPQAIGGTTANEMIHQLEGNVDKLVDELIPRPSTAEWEAICRVKEKVEAKTWECVELREIQEWPVEDVAKATGKTTGAVYMAVYRVHEMIAKEYQQVLRERQQGS